MSPIIFFIISICCMAMGHMFKAKRWGQYISVYEEPNESNLLLALAFGQTANAVLPVRIGDIIRVYQAGKGMKNGYSFSLATTIVDLYVDLLTVGAMSFGLSLIGKGGDKLLSMSHAYMWIFLAIIPLTAICVLFRKQVKRLIAFGASIFNERIEFRILYVSYLCITSLKDIVKNINKVRFLLYTLLMWLCYVMSYLVFAEAVQRYGYFYSISDVFAELFSGNSLYRIQSKLILFWGSYLLLPLAICFFMAFFERTKKKIDLPVKTYKSTLPQINRSDRHAFLRTYYQEENREHIQAYFTINNDVTIVEDKSAGSNASTVLIMRSDGNLFYRKYAFDEDAEKLKEQIDWIEVHQSEIPLPIIVGKKFGTGFAVYDMRSYSGTTSLFRYMHTMPVEAAWGVLEKALNEIRGLHTRNRKECDLATIEKYVSQKVEKNIQIIENNDRFIKSLEQYDYVVINGRKVRTLHRFHSVLSRENLCKVFQKDEYSDIHGDLTIENIVCFLKDQEVSDVDYVGKVKPETYYFIDPNTGNIHDSPFLDYGKLLQSLHGNYEFLMMVSSVVIEKNNINFMMTKSESYAKIYKMYDAYLNKVFSKEEVRNIYYHEAIHWLRLMPYKIRKDEKLAVVFYAGLLMVLDDLWEMEHADENKAGNI